MATVRTVEIAVSRKISKDYNSTEFRFAVQVDLGPGEQVPAVCAEWRERLAEEIRLSFRAVQAGNGNGAPAVAEQPRAHAEDDAE